MAVPVVDPSRAKYFPEMLIEAINEPAVTVGGNTLCSYTLDDRNVSLENPEVEATANMDMIFYSDGGEAGRIRSQVYTANDQYRKIKIGARKNLAVSLQMSVGAAANQWGRYNLTVRKPLPHDKLRNKESLTAEELSWIDGLHLEDYLSLGVIGYNQSLLDLNVAEKFQEIIPVERSMAAFAAGATADIGGNIIRANPGQLVVLLGVMMDTTAFTNAGAPPSDTFLRVDRDENDGIYMSLDYQAMPDQLYVPCYIPCLKKLRVYIRSATGSGAAVVPAGFIYGVRKLTVADYLKWNLPFDSPLKKSEAAELAQKYPDTYRRIKAGLI